MLIGSVDCGSILHGCLFWFADPPNTLTISFSLSSLSLSPQEILKTTTKNERRVEAKVELFFLGARRPSFIGAKHVSAEDQEFLLACLALLRTHPEQVFDRVGTSLTDNFGPNGRTIRTVWFWTLQLCVRLCPYAITPICFPFVSNNCCCAVVFVCIKLYSAPLCVFWIRIGCSILFD